jgi:hypothetical protein
MKQLQLGHITVKSVNKQQKQMVFHLRVECSPCQINEPKIRNFIKLQIEAAKNYLTNEGFIDEEKTTHWDVALQIESTE